MSIATFLGALWIWSLCERWDAHDERKRAKKEKFPKARGE